MRLNKFLAAAGIASRRRADLLIAQGLVQVNGEVIHQLGVQVDPQRDHVRVEGKLITGQQGAYQYLLLNKPARVMVTRADPEGRTTVFDLIRHIPKNIFHVGRLDYDTEGLLLLTNDGALAHQLTHPKFTVPRTYWAKVKGIPEEKILEKLRRGMTLDGKKLQPASVSVKKLAAQNAWLEIILHEGRNRQVRKMCEYVGHSVIRLRRVSYANLHLGSLPVGQVRHLTADELAGLRGVVSGERENIGGAPKKGPQPRSKKGWARAGAGKPKKKFHSQLPRKST